MTFGSVLTAEMSMRSLPSVVLTLTMPIRAEALCWVSLSSAVLTASAIVWLLRMAATEVAMERSLS